MTPADFVAAARSAGIEDIADGDVRDAAHEVFHALTAKLPEPWRREATHAALVRLFPGRRRAELWVHELHARVVEQRVCRELGVDPRGDLSRWVYQSAFEALKTSVPHIDPVKSIPLAEQWARSPEACAASDAVLAWARSRQGR